MKEILLLIALFFFPQCESFINNSNPALAFSIEKKIYSSEYSDYYELEITNNTEKDYWVYGKIDKKISEQKIYMPVAIGIFDKGERQSRKMHLSNAMKLHKQKIGANVRTRLLLRIPNFEGEKNMIESLSIYIKVLEHKNGQDQPISYVLNHKWEIDGLTQKRFQKKFPRIEGENPIK